MKTSYKYIAMAIAALLCSCNKEIATEVIESQVQISADITPSILTRVTDDGTSFTNGDAIKVRNTNRENKNLATYTYSESTGKWSTSDELYWEGTGANIFHAWYPATVEYGSFTIPADQTSGTAEADWMTATVSAKKADGTVNLSFNHNLAKVTVTIDSWSNEYSANERVANALELNSLSSLMSNDGTVSGDEAAKWVKAYVAQANTSFVAIIAPGTYASGDDIMQVYVNGSSTPLAVKTSSALTIEAGKAYRFKLSVGKNLAEITSSVTVGDWDDEEIENQEIMVQPIDPFAFDENRYIVYTSYDEMVPSGDDYWNMNPFFHSRISSINEIELKFQLAPFTSLNSEAFLFYCEEPYVNNGAFFNEDGLVLRWSNSGYKKISNERVISWEEIGISPTAVMVLNISLPNDLLTINGKEFSIPEVSTFTDIEYLFSSYYYIDDDGYAKHYEGVPTGTKLYYAKIWQNGTLNYCGHADQGEYTDGSLQNAWKSVYNGNTYYEFPRTNFESFWVHMYSSNWKHFDGGVDENSIPTDCIRFDSSEVKEACLAAFDTNGDNELSYVEAAAVTDLSDLEFPYSAAVSFYEFANFSSVTSIPDQYFYNSKLIGINFPKSLKVIGQYAFNQCANLSSITLPEGIELKYGAFRACTALSEVTIPSGIIWTTDAFYKCSGLRSVYISSGVEEIPDCAFQECTNLSYVSIASSVKKISFSAFRTCKSLERINIPAGVTDLSAGYQFYQCTALKSIILPEGIKTINGNTFGYCASLEEVTLPSTLTQIYDCFQECTSLKAVTIKSATPPELTDYIFDDCSNLQTIYVPSGSTSAYKNATYWFKYSNKIVGKTF